MHARALVAAVTAVDPRSSHQWRMRRQVLTTQWVPASWPLWAVVGLFVCTVTLGLVARTAPAAASAAAWVEELPRWLEQSGFEHSTDNQVGPGDPVLVHELVRLSGDDPYRGQFGAGRAILEGHSSLAGDFYRNPGLHGRYGGSRPLGWTSNPGCRNRRRPERNVHRYCRAAVCTYQQEGAAAVHRTDNQQPWPELRRRQPPYGGLRNHRCAPSVRGPLACLPRRGSPRYGASWPRFVRADPRGVGPAVGTGSVRDHVRRTVCRSAARERRGLFALPPRASELVRRWAPRWPNPGCPRPTGAWRVC